MQQTHGIPAILSLFFPGLGQLAKGQWKISALIWGVILTPWVLWGAAQPQLMPEATILIRPFVLLLMVAVWLWSVVDAYRRPVWVPHSSTAQPPVPHPRPPAPPTPSRDPVQLELPGHGTFPLAIVGESHYQQQLESVCGGRTADGVDHRCSALLVLDDANRYDPNAVRVEIDGQHVGHLSRDDAHAYREYLDLHASGPTVGVCRAKVTGGWDRGPDDRGYFGVKLDFALYG